MTNIIEPTITLFTTCKPFLGEAELIQKNALKMWKHIDQAKLIIGNEFGAKEAAKEAGAKHIKTVKRNSKSIPYINSLFSCAEQHAETKYIGYVNADILIRPDVIHSILRCLENHTSDKPILISGRRKNIPISKALPNDLEESLVSLKSIENRYGVWDLSNAIDLFVFNKNLFKDIPEFTIGYMQWDNWLLWQAEQMSAKIIDISLQAPLLHPVHGYYSDETGLQERTQGKEAQRNRKLSNGCSRDLNNATTHVLTETNVTPITAFHQRSIQNLCKPNTDQELAAGVEYLINMVEQMSQSEILDCCLTILNRIQRFFPRSLPIEADLSSLKATLKTTYTHVRNNNYIEAGNFLQDYICSSFLDLAKTSQENGSAINIWGAGAAGRQLINLFHRHGIRVQNIIDSNVSHAGKKVDGIPVITSLPKLSDSMQPSWTVIASMYVNEIEQGLLKAGYTKSQHFIA